MSEIINPWSKDGEVHLFCYAYAGCGWRRLRFLSLVFIKMTALGFVERRGGWLSADPALLQHFQILFFQTLKLKKKKKTVTKYKSIKHTNFGCFEFLERYFH